MTLSREEFQWAQDALPWVHSQETPLGVLGKNVMGHWPVLDARLAAMKCPLEGLKVIEMGPLDGHVSVGLMQLGVEELVCVEPRWQNQLKTRTRLAAWDFKGLVDFARLHSTIAETADLLVHFGVLYHLEDPARHLDNLSAFPEIWLDTHVCRYGEETVDGGRHFKENGTLTAGMQSTSFWPTKARLEQMIHHAEFNYEEIAFDENALNGPRGLWRLWQ